MCSGFGAGPAQTSHPPPRVCVCPPQVYPDGIRHIRADKRVNEWKTPGKKTIVRCAVNQRQVVIALTGGELVYFEMDPVSAG